MRRHLVFFALCLAVGLFAGGLITIKEPQDGAVVSPLTFSQRFFIKTPIAQLVEDFKDPLFINSLHPTEAHSIPAGIKLDWSLIGNRGKSYYEVLLSEDASMSDVRVIRAEHSEYTLNNLIPGKKYFWCAQLVTKQGEVTAKSAVFSFTVEDIYPRVIALPDCWNVRDLGGRPGIGGRKTPYGLIYRSGGLNFNSSDGGKTPGKNTVTDASIKEALEVLKIRTELDLRWAGEVAGMTQSPLGPTVQYIHIPTKVYGAMYTSEGMDNYAELFRLFTKPENYPIDFHCIAGADRTGTLAFLLESVMGWSEEDIRRDYTFTTHYSPRYFAAIDSLIKGMDEYGTPQEPIQLKAERFLLRAGVTPEEIAAFQRIIFGEDVPLSPALASNLKFRSFMASFDQATECQAIDNAPAVANVTLCGKEFPLRPTSWKSSPVKKVAADKEGRVLIYLDNRLARSVAVGFAGLPQGEYTLVDILSDTQYLCTGAKNWTAESLASTPIPVFGRAEAIFVATPIALAVPACSKKMPLPACTAPYLQANSLAETLVVDGKLDEVMASVKGIAMTDISGAAVKNAPVVRLAVNPAHDTLYIFMEVTDNTPTISLGGRDSQAVWESDCVEFFLSSMADADYYHVIVSRGGEIYDEKNRDDLSWTADCVTYAVAETAKGWNLEAAVSLDGFAFNGPLTLNACQQDNPGSNLRNLNPTGGDFHNSDARRPVLMK